MQRENFKSRTGFLLVSAGCAIGIGNVWRFPYVTGENGGGLFVLFYLAFLVLMGIPVLTMEFNVSVLVCVVPKKKARNITAVKEKKKPNTRQLR